MKLEVVVLGVSDVDRAKAFYQNLGWRCSRKSLPTSQNYLM
jgi:catechol 2,3-dioxygenase-like lactoylglutathione lyase family enzyme